MRVYNANGQLAHEQNGLAEAGVHTWHTGTNPAGMYFYQLVVDGRVWQAGKIVLR